jgi:hypothetical protein
MLKFIYLAVLAFYTWHASLATYQPLLGNYVEEGIRKRTSSSKHNCCKESIFSTEENRHHPKKNWEEIEKNMMLSLVKFRITHKAPLRFDVVVNNLKNSAIGTAFKDFAGIYGLFEEDYIECMRRRCLLALEWEKANKTTLMDL